MSPEPRRAIFLSNKQGRARAIIEQACHIAGIELRIVGGDTPSDTPEAEINWSDIVFTIGRGVPEALACNRNVYVLDLYGAKGYVRPDNVEHLRLDSYAGLLDSWWPTAEQLADELREGYDPSLRMREYVAAEHAPETVAERYLELAARVSRPVSLASRALRRIGGPLISRRTSKALSNARLGHPGAAMSALRGAQDLPPLLPSKLPAGVRVTFPDEGLRPT